MEKLNDRGGRLERLSIRVSSGEIEAIRRNAEEYGLPVSEYMRASGIGELPAKRQCSDKMTPDKNDTVTYLRNSSLLNSLDDKDILKTLGKLTIKKFRKEDIVLVHGDTNKFMYIILSGKVKVTQTSEDGKELILAMHMSGDFFGEMSLIDGGTASATVVAADNSTIAIISKDNFYSLIYTQRNILLNLLRSFCFRIRSANKTIEIMSQKSAVSRIKMLLLMFSEKYGVKKDDGIMLSVLSTHQELADMTGLTRETATKILNELQEEGAISVGKTKHIILNDSFFTPFLSVHPRM